MRREQLTLGLIGAGRIGRLHAEHLLKHIPRARLLMVADVVEEVACSVAAPHAVTDHRRVLESREVEALAICSATDTHAQIIEEAAAAGKHIFCEKPIALSLAGSIGRRTRSSGRACCFRWASIGASTRTTPGCAGR